MTNPTPIDWKSRALEAERLAVRLNADRLAAEATVTRMREVLEEVAGHLQCTVDWPCEKEVQEHYSRTDWQSGFDCATNDASKEAAKALVKVRDCLSTLSGGGEQ